MSNVRGVIGTPTEKHIHTRVLHLVTTKSAFRLHKYLGLHPIDINYDKYLQCRNGRYIHVEKVVGRGGEGRWSGGGGEVW